MKKLLSLFAALVASLSLHAQMPLIDRAANQQAQFENSPAVLINQAPIYSPQGPMYAEGDKVSIYMPRPTNILHCYRSPDGLMGYNNPVMFVPPFAPITLSVVKGDTINSIMRWVYRSSDQYYTQTAEPAINVTWATPYPDWCIGPRVIGSCTGMVDSTFILANNIYVSQQRLYLGSDPGVVGNISLRAWMSNHFWGSGTMSINSYYLSNLPTAKTYLSNVYSGSGIKVDSVKGFGEMFYKPAYPLAVRGAWFYIYTPNKKLPGALKLKIFDNNMNLVATSEGDSASLVTYASANQMQHAVKFANLKDAGGNAIDEVVMTDQFSVFLVFSNENDAIYPLYHGNIPAKSMGTIRLLGDFTAGENKYSDATIGLNLSFTNGTTTAGLYCGIDADYQWLYSHINGTNVSADGETLPIDVYASEPSTKWTITQADDSALPSWITVSAQDSTLANNWYAQKSTLTFTVAPLPVGALSRECNVKLAYKGNTHIINITQDGSVNREIGITGYATMYYATLPLEVPAGVTATTYKVVDGHLVESHVYNTGDVIAAGTGFVVNTATPGTYTFKSSLSAGTGDPENMLTGSDTEVTDAQAGYLYYILSTPADDPNGEVGFYFQIDDGSEVESEPHKAYLKVPVDAAAGAKYFLFNDDPTGINTLDNDQRNSNAATYNMQGQRVDSKAGKGVYIQNGKKVIKK